MYLVDTKQYLIKIMMWLRKLAITNPVNQVKKKVIQQYSFMHFTLYMCVHLYLRFSNNKIC